MFAFSNKLKNIYAISRKAEVKKLLEYLVYSVENRGNNFYSFHLQKHFPSMNIFSEFSDIR